MNKDQGSMFVLSDGRNVLFTFALVSSLFLLWGFCNGMIDVMDKHFQEELGLTLAQSAWVQFAHYLGYFLMAMPAGWLATRLGYRGGIIAGLLLVAAGGFWFIPSTRIAEFWAFLVGVCAIAAGLTFLETVANPYTTVLGPPRYAATRINLAQSCNGIGWILGPIAGGMFFYGTDAAGMSTGAQTLWIPYAGVALVVLVLAVIFYFAPVPDIQTEDDYGIGQAGENAAVATAAERQVARVPAYFLLWFNSIVLVGVFGMIFWLILSAFDLGPKLVGLASRVPHPAGLAITPDNALLILLAAAGCVASLVLAVVLIPVTAQLSHHSIWSHPHFSGATLAQFFYVAAQAGIFSFVINYMVWEVPPLPVSWRSIGAASEQANGKSKESLIEVRTRLDQTQIRDLASLAGKLSVGMDAVSEFVRSQLSEATLRAMADYDASAGDYPLSFHLARDLDDLVTRDMRATKEPKPTLYDESRFSGVTLQDRTRELLAQQPTGVDRCRLNRMLLADAYPTELPFQDGILCFSNRAASFLATLGFICFLTGRFTGAGLLRKASAHKIVGLYGLMNVLICLLIVLKLGWISVVCVFLSYFFMSIMFPTIFALGIFGLGERAKGASAYIVMAIMGGAMLPKVMGAVADRYDMSRGFVVPMACFVIIALYGYGWPLLSKADSLHGVKAGGGH
ncbi:MAG: MFS transporter [Pirellulaceae bacterium]|jgi:fucose permease|nr:MFS transporter [Pirellulaceae bacterium]